MAKSSPKLSKDREEIILKFGELLAKADELDQAYMRSNDQTFPPDKYFELRVSSINLLSRLASVNSIYVEEMTKMQPLAGAIKGVLRAAQADYQQGFMADHRLLISAEVFSDLLVQAEVLLDHHYKDAAAVLIRAVLEDGIRRLCQAHEIEAGKLETIQALNEKLYKKQVYTALVHKEIIAKVVVGNNAAHGKFDQYNEDDVKAFLDYVLRFLAEHLK